MTEPSRGRGAPAIGRFALERADGSRSFFEEVIAAANPCMSLPDAVQGDRDAPGLGVDVDEEAAARFPYDPKSIPVNRRTDGSVHDW